MLEKGSPTFIAGDLNIDRLHANDPERHPDLKPLILEKFEEENNQRPT